MQARKGDIDINELTLPVQLESERAYAEFQANWDDACKAGNPKLLRVLWKTFGKVRAAGTLSRCYPYGSLVVIPCNLEQACGCGHRLC